MHRSKAVFWEAHINRCAMWKVKERERERKRTDDLKREGEEKNCGKFKSKQRIALSREKRVYSQCQIIIFQSKITQLLSTRQCLCVCFYHFSVLVCVCSSSEILNRILNHIQGCIEFSLYRCIDFGWQNNNNSFVRYYFFSSSCSFGWL